MPRWIAIFILALLDHAGEGVVGSGGGRESECAGEEFGKGVGCADGVGGGESMFVLCARSPCGGGRRGFWAGFWRPKRVGMGVRCTIWASGKENCILGGS